MKKPVIDELEFLDKVFLAILPVMLQDESRWRRHDVDEFINVAWGIANKALKQRSSLHDAFADKELEEGYRVMAANEAREKENYPDRDEFVDGGLGC
ncbi:hypothetical protein [Nitrosospira multiformis]|uniref:Uncharacterized protein n=1 Tax=Nitrosospira multiformis TaxID=1231 RepID=A0A1I7I3A8_9PROT|nr:hypothetical protein [Nitrosospira multiformis]SFU67443.1 hypothetical protein SAMN05216417_11410 [Nitrosospira multiformis]